MGNTFTTETLCSEADDGHNYWVSVNWRAFAKGRKKKCFQGFLNGNGPRFGELVSVKALRDIANGPDKWKFYIAKCTTAKKFADDFNQKVQGQGQIVINVPFTAMIDVVAKTSHLNVRARTRNLSEGEWVSVETFIQGKFERFSGFSETNLSLYSSSNVVEAFSHFTYYQSSNTLLVCDLQGVKDGDTYQLTDPVIHSTNHSFGVFDEGLFGIGHFFKYHHCNDICYQWPRPQPLSPPPAFEDVANEAPLVATAPPQHVNHVT